MEDRMLIDAAAHPNPVSSDAIRDYLEEPWKSRLFPGPERYAFSSPAGNHLEDTARREGLAGSDRETLVQKLIEENGADRVVLLPLTRGLLANVYLAAAICSATNRWLTEEWLTDHRFLGSIRVEPRDPQSAIDEIEKWAGHPQMVQVAVPLQSHHPYGQGMYAPIWEAAARHDLPIAVHVDGGASIDFPTTGAGDPRYSIEYEAMYPFNFSYHLASLIAEGTLVKGDGCRFVFADGGLDFLSSVAWRFDKDWRSCRTEIPWVRELPTSDIHDQVRFIMNLNEGPPGSDERVEWLRNAHADELLMYGSNYPSWDFLSARDLEPLPPEIARRVGSENAASFYGLS
jgi:predicted TIM-barrel fold metal-dependent hydrolase